jgi:predicted TIM-barrel fold metal-dependent hydrolase
MKMRVDVHTHMWSEAGIPSPIRQYVDRRSIKGVVSDAGMLLSSMDERDIDIAVVVALVHTPNMSDDEVLEINRFVMEQVNLYPSRFVRFCAVNPRSKNALSILRSEVEDRGAKGLKLHGAMQEVDIDDPLLWPIYEQMEEYGYPILFHSGDIGVLPYRDSFTRVTRFDKIACAFPNLPIVLGHAGRIDFTKTAGLLRKHRNVYADISSVIGRDRPSRTLPLLKLLETIKSWAGATDRVLFGSDFPLYSIDETLSVVDELIEQVNAGVFGQTPISCDDLLAIRDANGEAYCRRFGLID